jgi:hypothetical protein
MAFFSEKKTLNNFINKQLDEAYFCMFSDKFLNSFLSIMNL